MRKKAILFDLDNTIYPVHSIGDILFSSLFDLIHKGGEHDEHMDKIRQDIMRRPFQLIAKEYGFTEELTQKSIAILNDLSFEGKISTFEDYLIAKNIPIDKFLVTTGFLKLQQSKVKAMKLEADFKEIHIVDPTSSTQTKKDVFANIMQRHNYSPAEVLVVGDDLHSEIKAAIELGIEAVLYDKYNLHSTVTIKKISDFRELKELLV